MLVVMLVFDKNTFLKPVSCCFKMPSIIKKGGLLDVFVIL